MTDLKISQFADGGLVDVNDEIAAVRSGLNTKVTVGSAATADVGSGPGDIPTNGDLGSAAYLEAGTSDGDVLLITDGPDGPNYVSSANGKGGDVTIPASLNITLMTCTTSTIPWNNMPSALNFFLSSNIPRQWSKVDLTDYTQVRIVVSLANVPGSSGSKICARYIKTYSATPTDWSMLSSSEVEVSVSGSTGVYVSNWMDLVDDARDDVIISIMGYGGDGVADPTFCVFAVQFR